MEIVRGTLHTDLVSFTVASTVVHGFGRGSRLLGYPTANLDITPHQQLFARIPTGVYYGTCTLEGCSYSMVMNVGWSPFFANQKKTIEVHILHQFDEDFYGAHLVVHVRGYVRPELDFDSLEELKDAIAGDIEWACQKLF